MGEKMLLFSDKRVILFQKYEILNILFLTRKGKMKNLIVSVGVMGMVLALGYGGYAYLSSQQEEDENASNQESVEETASVEMEADEGNAPLDTEYISSEIPPERLGVYFGVYEDATINAEGECVFFTSEYNVQNTEEYIGSVLCDFGEVRRTVSEFDFRELSNIRLMSFLSDVPNDINSFATLDENTMYLGVIYSDVLEDEAYGSSPLQNNYQDIIRVDLESQESEFVLRLDLAKYGTHENVTSYDGFGPAFLNQAVGDYLVFSVAGCYGCSAYSPLPQVIRNVETGAEVILDERIGGVLIHLDTMTYSYQYLQELQIECPEVAAPYCVDGYQTVFEPAGEVFSEALP
jgi:hypothetical protein